MIKVCISSDVSNRSISIDLNDIRNVFPSGQFSTDSWCDTMFFKEELIFIKDRVSEQIELLFDKVVYEESKMIPYTILVYKGEELRLNYRKEIDFNIGVLISLFNIVYQAIERNGFLVLYNLTYLNREVDSMIFSVLKLGLCTTVESLEKELIRLKKKYELTHSFSINEIRKSIDVLLNLGIVDSEKDGVNYKVTAKGYMLQM